MEPALCVSANVIFTQLEHLRTVLASEPRLKCGGDSRWEADSDEEWREKLNQRGLNHLHADEQEEQH